MRETYTRGSQLSRRHYRAVGYSQPIEYEMQLSNRIQLDKRIGNTVSQQNTRYSSVSEYSQARKYSLKLGNTMRYTARQHNITRYNMTTDHSSDMQRGNKIQTRDTKKTKEYGVQQTSKTQQQDLIKQHNTAYESHKATYTPTKKFQTPSSPS